MKCLKSGTYWTAYHDNKNNRYVARLVFTSYEGQELYDYEITKEIYDKLGSFEDDYDNVGLIKTARMTHSMEDTRHTPHAINSVYDDNWEAVFKAAYQCAMDEVDELAETGDVEACVWVTAHNSVYTATEEEKQKVFRCWSKAAENGWVDGYSDGTFLPDAKIKRCEAMAIVNRVLGRLPQSKDDLLPNMVTWPDNMNESKWFYLHVQEATNSHDCEHRADGSEYWTVLTEVPDWERYER